MCRFKSYYPCHDINRKNARLFDIETAPPDDYRLFNHIQQVPRTIDAARSLWADMNEEGLTMGKYVEIDKVVGICTESYNKNESFGIGKMLELCAINIVRCRDCQYQSKEALDGYHRCTKRGFEVTDDFYCKDGVE